MNRMLTVGALALGTAFAASGMKRQEITFEYVVAQAQALVGKEYRPQGKQAPSVLLDLKYDQLREIRFRLEKSLWLEDELPFQAQFFHLGHLYDRSVALNEFTDTHVQRVPYVADFFDMGASGVESNLRSSIGYAGFRLLYPLKDSEWPYDEVASFLGASYFRAVGKDGVYGLSARGIAINSGLSSVEEFPKFEEFWLGKPMKGSKTIRLYALLYGPSVVGAYQFDLSPGTSTRIDVKAKLFVTAQTESFGIAPLTSMFLRGENTYSNLRDYRPEIHDSDGLQIKAANGEVFWRPLDISGRTRLSYISANDVAGFGLMQRDREFDRYQDLGVSYEQRSSAWITPKGNWGVGHVKLIELPTVDEFNDNIVAFWEPASLPMPGESLDIEYSIAWNNKQAVDRALPRALATRLGDHPYEPGVKVFVVDFLETEPERYAISKKPEIVATVVGPAQLKDSYVDWNPHANAWRVTLQLSGLVDTPEPVEMSCRLAYEPGVVSETWMYQWTP